MRNHEKIQFVRVPDAIRYLHSVGWRTSAKSLYRHLQQGKLSEKTWTKETLDSYAAEYLRPVEKPLAPGGRRAGSSQELREIQIEKTRAAMEYTRLRTRQLQDKFIDRDVCISLLCHRSKLYQDIMHNYSFELARYLQHRLEKDANFFWDMQTEIDRHFRKHFGQLAEMPFIDMRGDRA